MSVAQHSLGRLTRVLLALALLATAALLAPSQARAATGGTLSMASTTIEKGAPVVIEYTAVKPLAKNWVGIYKPGQEPGSVNSTYWEYTPDASGTVTFPDVSEGRWVAHLLENDGYTQLATPIEFTVGTPPEKPTPADPHTPAPLNTADTDGVIFRESFDALSDQLEPRVDDPAIPAGKVGFTHTTPEGWESSYDESMEGIGVTEWRGWSFTTREFWTAAEDQMRFRFGRSQDVIAVVDSDEFADANNVPHNFAATLTSTPVDVANHKAIELSFDSHYRGAADQTAVVTVSFDQGEEREVVRFDSKTVTDDYDGSKINSNETHRIEVPEGAKTATFAWKFESKEDSWYWAIDSVTVRGDLAEQPSKRTSAWVVSDIQGHPQDLSHGLTDLHEVRPEAGGLLMVGDIVATGTEAEWNEIYQVMEERKDILPPVTAAAIGNHESYAQGGWPVLRDRFLEFAERDKVWGEYVLKGAAGDLPVLVIGQEFARSPEVPMSAEQVAWLSERLDHWSKQKKMVLVISHFPLGDTHSASWIPWYHKAYQYNDLITEIMADHPNAVMMNGHTHYPAELGDWAVQRRTAEGHPDGFWAINTLAMHIEWDAKGENTQGIKEVTTRDINRGLTVDLYDDRLVVTARDFGTVADNGMDNSINEELRSVTIANPFVQPKVEGDLDPTPTPDPTPSPSPSPDPTQSPTSSPSASTSPEADESTAAPKRRPTGLPDTGALSGSVHRNAA
ncbi:metallophosphoesterase family protein [Enemella sp. A6]|uniref:metallophosphoesterase family protein n=1 Tax=Enemella sp. A6 TaxID=3440152 RepID=UPI003EC028A2